MRAHIQSLLSEALAALRTELELDDNTLPTIYVERARDRSHGDFASNLAMVLAKSVKRSPRELAQTIVDHIPASSQIQSIQVAGPGFINFVMTDIALQQVVSEVLQEKSHYGHSEVGQQQRVMIEFVSTNPTGPLHVGHGRGAAYGAAMASLLSAAGFDVHREYYVNDAGRQMQILAVSVWLRYLALCGENFQFPKNAYQGDYIIDIAKLLEQRHQTAWCFDTGQVFNDVPPDENEAGEGDKEAHIDALIDNAKSLLGVDRFDQLIDLALAEILRDIRADLSHFGIEFEHWFSERQLQHSGAVTACIERLKQAGYVYEQAGALWFQATEFGDDKDRVLVRDNGQTTYFAADIAYHLDKFQRNFETVIDVWGADHHGYMARIKAAMQALDVDPDTLVIQLVQFAVLYRDKEKVQMSTRSGSYVTLRELCDEVGVDAARFFYVMRKADQHLDFDLNLAKSQSQDNPVYYIQYAHARICSVLRQLEEQKLGYDEQQGLAALSKLSEPQERHLLWQLQRYPEVLEVSALQYEPHTLANFMREIANNFHAYYNGCQFLVTDEFLRAARISLIKAVRQVIANGLTLLGVSAPETM